MMAALHGYYVDRVVAIIKQSGAQTVLDVGCGDGWTTGRLTKSGLNAVGIDWSNNAVRYAAVRVPDAKFLALDVRDPKLSEMFPDKFEAACFIEVIEHIPPADCVQAVRNITAHLKPGATFVLTTPSTNFPNTNAQHYQHFTEKLLREIIADAGGLTITGIEGYGNMTVEKAHWRRARWFNNRYFQIKPIHEKLLERFNRDNTAGPTTMDCCHGFILTMRA